MVKQIKYNPLLAVAWKKIVKPLGEVSGLRPAKSEVSTSQNKVN